MNNDFSHNPEELPSSFAALIKQVELVRYQNPMNNIMADELRITIVKLGDKLLLDVANGVIVKNFEPCKLINYFIDPLRYRTDIIKLESIIDTFKN